MTNPHKSDARWSRAVRRQSRENRLADQGGCGDVRAGVAMIVELLPIRLDGHIGGEFVIK